MACAREIFFLSFNVFVAVFFLFHSQNKPDIEPPHSVSLLSFYVNCYLFRLFIRNERIDFQPSLALIAFFSPFLFRLFFYFLLYIQYFFVQSLLLLYQCSVCLFVCFFAQFERSRIFDFAFTFSVYFGGFCNRSCV